MIMRCTTYSTFIVFHRLYEKGSDDRQCQDIGPVEPSITTSTSTLRLVPAAAGEGGGRYQLSPARAWMQIE